MHLFQGIRESVLSPKTGINLKWQSQTFASWNWYKKNLSIHYMFYQEDKSFQITYAHTYIHTGKSPKF